MTKIRLFRPDFLSFMTSLPIIFSRQGGSAPSLKTVILCRFKIFTLSNVFFFQKTIITEHKKSLVPHTWYHGNRCIHAVIDHPNRGARGGRSGPGAIAVHGIPVTQLPVLPGPLSALAEQDAICGAGRDPRRYANLVSVTSALPAKNGARHPCAT